MSVELMVLAAHPDDAELACSGTVKKTTNEGLDVAFVDCTRGELGTRGTPEIRKQEAIKAAEILGVRFRECLDMPDGFIAHTNENILKVVGAIRMWKPRILLVPPPVERHPDHEAVHKLGRAAAFLSGLARVETSRDGVPQTTHRPDRILCYQQQYDFPRLPDLYVDISDTFEYKMRSIQAYSSQFYLPDQYQEDEPDTFLTRPEFLDEIEARAVYHGSRIGVRYAEAFLSIEPVAVSSLRSLR